MSTLTLGENVLMKNDTAAMRLPTHVTVLHPKWLARALTIGPENENQEQIKYEESTEIYRMTVRSTQSHQLQDTDLRDSCIVYDNVTIHIFHIGRLPEKKTAEIPVSISY